MKKLFMLLCVAMLSTIQGMEDNPDALQKKFVNIFTQQAYHANLPLKNDPSLAFNKIMSNVGDEYFRHPVYHLAHDFNCINRNQASLQKTHAVFNESNKKFTLEERKTIFPSHHQYINQ